MCFCGTDFTKYSHTWNRFWEKMQIVTDVHNKTWEFSPTTTQLASLWTEDGLLSHEHISPDQGKQLDDFLADEFQKDPRVLGRFCLVEHVIDTGTATEVLSDVAQPTENRKCRVGQNVGIRGSDSL